jgi:hypothetical protein
MRVVEIKRQHGGGRGRPLKTVDQDLLQEVFSSSRKVSQSRLAKLLGIHRHTLRRNLKDYDLTPKYSTLTDAELDALAEQFRSTRPNAGVTVLMGHLQGQGVEVPRQRARDSYKRVDRIGTHMRAKQTTHRRAYSVKCPNSLWHMDGYHKLVQYGFVLHGITDGYSRKVSEPVHMLVVIFTMYAAQFRLSVLLSPT